MAQGRFSGLRRIWRALRWPLGIGLISAALLWVAHAGRLAHDIVTWLMVGAAVLVMIEGWRRGR